MPDSPLVTLTLWKDAKTDPPEDDGHIHPTDVGLAYRLHGEWYGLLNDRAPLTVKPSVWCDPVPPGGDALTVEDLHAIVKHCYNALPKGEAFEVFPAAARLRRALEQIGTP